MLILEWSGLTGYPKHHFEYPGISNLSVEVENSRLV
jgi:hypothetical protein